MWLQLIIITIIVAAGVRLWNGWQGEAKARGVEQAEKQIAEGLLRNEREAANDLRKAIDARDARIAELSVKQKARVTNETKQRKIDPTYAHWADERVPQLVVDELRSTAGIDGSVRPRAGDEQSGVALQANATSPTANDGQRATAPVRLGPSGKH